MLFREKIQREERTIIFCTFESEFAKSGGLSAVMGVLPKIMGQNERCILIAPHFNKITHLDILIKCNKIKNYIKICSYNVEISSQKYEISITEVIGIDNFITYLLSSDGFFTSPFDPYINPKDPNQSLNPYTNANNFDKLTEDALFFCIIAPRAVLKLSELGLIRNDNYIFHLQDWETACIAQSIQRDSNFKSVTCVLTIHNPYDRHLNNNNSRLISQFVNHLGLREDNVLVQTIPLVGSPISTVSRNFSDELISDPLHTEFFAKHIVDYLVSKGLVGIDNGIFGDLKFPFSENARQHVQQGNFENIIQEKRERRKNLAKIIMNYQKELSESPDINRTTWGADLDLSDPNIPVFFMMGRDDPLQKGFDVVSEAIRMIPEGKARYIFTPIPGEEGQIGLEFLKKLAEDRPGEVKIFPFRLAPEPYEALQKGSSFLVMASLYEPFGAANGAYLEGMPVIARATGGLVQQVVPYPSASLSRYGRQLVTLFHSLDSPPTGFLFREPSILSESEVQGWQKIGKCAYWNQYPKGSRVDDRKDIPLFAAMVQSAAWALQDAINLYTSNQIEYAKMIYDGYALLNKFSWDRAIKEYQHIYDTNSTVINIDKN